MIDEEFIAKANETIKEEFENENVLEFAKQLIDIASVIKHEIKIFFQSLFICFYFLLQ